MRKIVFQARRGEDNDKQEKTYPKEFKIEAVRLPKRTRRTQGEIPAKVGVSRRSLRR